MNVLSSFPRLYTKDIKGTISFYSNVLGFKCSSHHPSYSWAFIERDGNQILFAEPDEGVAFEKAALSGSIFFRINDAAGFWKNVKDKAAIISPFEDKHNSIKAFAIADNNGYTLQFGEPLEQNAL